MKKMNNKRGFTLAELLIVVAIIAVLVAISIPIFTTQLEKSREATDAANLRAAYATASVAVLESEGSVSAGPVAMTQTDAGFKTDAVKDTKVGGVALSDSSLATAAKGVSFYVTVGTDGSVKFETNPTGSKEINPITGGSGS